jgi:hypothetical protein
MKMIKYFTLVAMAATAVGLTGCGCCQPAVTTPPPAPTVHQK